MRFYHLILLIVGTNIQTSEFVKNLDQNLVDEDKLFDVGASEFKPKIYTLVDGAVYNGECANVDEIITNYMTDYQLEKTGKREGYNDCLLRNGVVKLSTFSTNQQNNFNNDKLMKIYAADLFRLALQTVHGREMLKITFQENPDLIVASRANLLPVMPDFDQR